MTRCQTTSCDSAEAARLLRHARRSRNPDVRHLAMLLERASASHVAGRIHAFDREGLVDPDPLWRVGRPRRIDRKARTRIVRVALARPMDLGEPFTTWNFSRLHDHLVRRRIVPAISHSQLWRILNGADLRLQYRRTWNASPDPDFKAKRRRVDDPYANRSGRTRVPRLDDAGAGRPSGHVRPTRTCCEAHDRMAVELEEARARAAADRACAAAERDRAVQDRADADRELARLEAELHSAHLDELTGAYRREMGRLALSHEIERARRGDGRFVLAFVDVDGLKGVNDREGHAAGDRVLQTLVGTMRLNVRSFDPIVRYGGDEFVCGLGGVDRGEVEGRFDVIDRSVQEDVGVGISVGFAALAANETLDQLTARADAALLEAKKRRSG
jgi:diguanylate cyclase (GGDEF)-like protein